MHEAIAHAPVRYIVAQTTAAEVAPAPCDTTLRGRARARRTRCPAIQHRRTHALHEARVDLGVRQCAQAQRSGLSDVRSRTRTCCRCAAASQSRCRGARKRRARSQRARRVPGRTQQPRSARATMHAAMKTLPCRSRAARTASRSRVASLALRALVARRECHSRAALRSLARRWRRERRARAHRGPVRPSRQLSIGLRDSDGSLRSAGGAPQHDLLEA